MTYDELTSLIQHGETEQVEFKSIAGDVVVRFYPTRYIAPTRIGHDLSPLQRELLEIIASTVSAPLSCILSHIDPPVPMRTVQDNLVLLRNLGLIDLVGSRRWARWKLKGT